MAFVRLLVLTTLSLGFTFSLSSCGVGHLLNIKWGKDEKKFKTKADAMTVFNGSVVQCEGACPATVGGLVTYSSSWGSYSVSVCSMTLIAPNKILTNRHCLPDDLDYKNASCAGRIRLKFPAAQGYAKEDHECSSIESMAKYKPSNYDSTIYQDWAVVTMASSTNRPFAQTNRDGIESGEKVTFFSSFFTYNQPLLSVVGTIRRVDCSTEFDTAGIFGYINKFSSIFKATNCTRNLIKGTSGSGMFDQNLRLLGLLSTGYRTDGVDLDVHGSPTIGGTNIACISAFGSKPADPEACTRN